MARYDAKEQTSVTQTHNYYAFCEFTLTSHDDLLGRQPTQTRDEVVDSCPHSTREVPEGSDVGSQTRYVQAMVTRVLTSQVVQDEGLGEEDQRPPRLDVGPNLVGMAKSFIMQPKRLQFSGRG